MKVKLSLVKLTDRNTPSVFTTAHSPLGTLVKEWSESGSLVRVINPFPGFQGEVNLASGRSEHEVIIGAGQSGGPHVVRYTQYGRVDSFFAYAPEFHGGVRVAAGSRDGEIITGPGPGGSPNVRVFHDGTLLKSWYAGDPKDPSGVNVAATLSDNTGSHSSVKPFEAFESHPELADKVSLYIEFLPGTDPSVINQVANLYSSYKINVTNIRPTESVDHVVHVIVGTDFSFLNNDEKGVAVLDGFHQGNEFNSYVGYVETKGLNLGQQGVAIAHESAHLLGLPHSNFDASVMFPQIHAGTHFIGTDDQLLTFYLGKF